MTTAATTGAAEWATRCTPGLARRGSSHLDDAGENIDGDPLPEHDLDRSADPGVPADRFRARRAERRIGDGMVVSVYGRLRTGAPAAFHGTPVRFAYLFGSHARGDAGPRSDVDVAVHLGGAASSLKVALMVDLRRLRSVLDRIGAETTQLRRLAAMSDEALSADPERMPGVKYRLQVAVEACIDAAEHVIASEGLRAPESYADAFTVLGEVGMLDRELTTSLEDAERFRNLLVHQYGAVDDDRVREILRTRITDLDRFRAAIARIATDT